jgi:uncharacterized protein
MKTAEYWIKHLGLNSHPEGGFFKETYRANEAFPGLPERFAGRRNFSTAIYFLLKSENRSVFHRIKSDELWHFYAGSSLTLYVLERGNMTMHRLGQNPDAGESLQIVIPAGAWFGAMVNEPESYVLSGCTVSPGFDFDDFEIAEKSHLLNEYPQHHSIIEMLT